VIYDWLCLLTWECYDALCPGTLLIVNAALHVFIFTDSADVVKRRVCPFSFCYVFSVCADK
jgi:hypothetical protein